MIGYLKEQDDLSSLIVIDNWDLFETGKVIFSTAQFSDLIYTKVATDEKLLLISDEGIKEQVGFLIFFFSPQIMQDFFLYPDGSILFIMKGLCLWGNLQRTP